MGIEKCSAEWINTHWYIHMCVCACLCICIYFFLNIQLPAASRTMRDDMDALLAKVLKVQGFRICLRIAGGLLGDAGGWFPSIQTFNASGRHAETIFPILSMERKKQRFGPWKQRTISHPKDKVAKQKAITTFRCNPIMFDQRNRAIWKWFHPWFIKALTHTSTVVWFLKLPRGSRCSNHMLLGLSFCNIPRIHARNFR